MLFEVDSMDPLSIAASVVTIAGAAATLVRGLEKLNQLRDATGELCALINEISDFRVVLQEFGNYVEESQERLELPLDYLAQLLQRGRDALLRLDTIVHYELLKLPTVPGEVRVFHRNWLRKNSTIKKL